MNLKPFLLIVFLLLILLSYPAYADISQDINNFFASIFNSIISFFNSISSVLFPTPPPTGNGGGSGNGDGDGLGLPPGGCAIGMSFSTSGKDTCSVKATITARDCDGKPYSIKDNGNTKCSGTISGDSRTIDCDWTVTTGSYTYKLYVDNKYKSSKSVTCYETPPCSAFLTLNSMGINTCTITATINAQYCKDKIYSIESTACSGTIASDSTSFNCDWQVSSAGTYTYNLYIDGSLETSKSVTCPEQTCSCGSWQNKGCGEGGCASNQMYQTRSCNPSACDTEERCQSDASCETVSDCDSQCKAREFASGTCRPSMNGELIFRSGFESGIYLDNPTTEGGNQWWQWLKGEDEGYAWTTDLPSQYDYGSRFQYLVSSSHSQQELNNYVETRIDNVIGHDGTSTRALYMDVKDDDPVNDGLTRNQYNVYLGNSLSEAYVRYWIKIQQNLKDVMPESSGWRMIMEWKETDDDYRWNIHIQKDSSGNLYWYTQAQWGTLGSSPQHWNIKSYDPQPESILGEWALLEVYWKHSTGSDGRVWVAINGQTVADYHGQNKKNNDVFGWNLFKVYTGPSHLALGKHYQWIDDFELWSEIPTSTEACQQGETPIGRGGCSLGETCCCSGVLQKCTDGTIYGECSSTKPKHCDSGNLIDYCSYCGCDIGYECQADESCKKKEVSTSFNIYRYKSFGTADSVADIAEYYDMTQSWGYTGSMIPQIHSLRPDFKALFYRNVKAVYPYWEDEWELFKANNWVLKDSSGNYVYSTHYGAENYMFVDIGNSDYQQWVSNKIKEVLNEHGFDGVFADEGLYVTSSWGSASGDPINPRTGKIWEDEEVKKAYLGLHQKIKQTIGSKLLIANGIWRGRSFYNHQSDFSELLQNSPMDGFMSEGIWYTYNGYWFSEDYWKKSLDFLIWVQDNYLSTNKYFVPVCSHRNNPSGVSNAKLSNYCTASLLLGIKAGQKNIYFHNGDIEFLKTYGQELFDKANSIGDPSGSYYIVNKLYVRDFSNGKALVNPTSSSYTINLGQEYENLNGQTVSGTYTVYAHTGEILTKV